MGKLKPKKVKADMGIDRLYKAVQNYIEKNGGKLLVIGGVEIQQWPQDGEFKFRVAIRCIGNKPSFPDNKNT